jgi:hypothetical protein
METIFRHEMIEPFLFGDDSDAALENVQKWIYSHFAGAAYGGFLKYGRGLLIGPIVCDQDGHPVLGDRLRRIFSEAKPRTVSMQYYGWTQAGLMKVIPEKHIRDGMAPAIERYNPETQVLILLLRDGNPHTFIPGFGHETVSPLDLYEAAKADRAETGSAGKPN